MRLDALCERVARALVPTVQRPSHHDYAAADRALAALGLNDLDAAVERAAQQMGQEARDNRDAGYLWALEMGDRYAARRVLEAALDMHTSPTHDPAEDSATQGDSA